MLAWAVKEQDGPVAIRYPRGCDGCYTDDMWSVESPVIVERDGKDFAIITYGTMVNNCVSACKIMQMQGINVSVIRLTQLNPLPVAALNAALTGIKKAVVVEEVCRGSGICEAICTELGISCTALDLGSEYVTHGKISALYQKYGLDPESIAKKIQEVLHHES